MAYYDRDYYREQPPRSMNWPKLGAVGKVLLALVAGAFVALFVVTQESNLGPLAASGQVPWLSELALTPHALLPLEDGWPAPWQLLTAVLIPLGILDVALVCICFVWLFGATIEAPLGSRRYATLLIAAALIGNAASACLDPLLVRSGVISVGFAPLTTAIILANARINGERRSFLGLKISTIMYVFVAIGALLAINGYMRESPFPGPRVVSSIPAMVGAGVWSVLYTRRVRDTLVKPDETNQEFLEYARQFKVEKERTESSPNKGEGQTTRHLKKLESRKTQEEQNVDKLLDRIAKEGISSLTRSERAFLERVSREKREGGK